MVEQLTIDSGSTAVLIMDYQRDIVGAYPEGQQKSLLQKASQIAAESRRAGLPIVYVVVRFREGYPEVSPRNRTFRGIKEAGRLQEGTPGAEIHPEVAPQPGDVVVTKRRVGAFATTDLMAVLNARDIRTLALLGIATSGVVLSTVRLAADLDYELIVVADCCADRDEEVHRLLTEKVFPRQARVVSAEEFLQALASL